MASRKTFRSRAITFIDEFVVFEKLEVSPKYFLQLYET